MNCVTSFQVPYSLPTDKFSVFEKLKIITGANMMWPLAPYLTRYAFADKKRWAKIDDCEADEKLTGHDARRDL